MITAHSLEQVRQLPIPASIMLAVQSELLSAFADDEEALQDFWQESGSVLYLVTDDDPPDVITKQDSITELQLTLATEHPEYVVAFNDGTVCYYLALTITSDDGGGCYLLINANHQSHISTQLVEHLI